ncbi:MAG: hypothetical protein WBW53_21615 [Terriglobales bacterium]
MAEARHFGAVTRRTVRNHVIASPNCGRFNDITGVTGVTGVVVKLQFV